MAKAFTVTTEIAGFEVSLNYLTSNQRITTVQWAMPSIAVVHIWMWNNGTLFYDRIITGPASGTESVAGNHKMEWITAFGELRWMVPAYLTYQINVETVGQ